LRHRQQVVGRSVHHRLKFLFRLGAVLHFEIQIRQFTAQFEIARIEREGSLKLVYIWIALRQQLASFLSHARLSAAGCREQRRICFLVARHLRVNTPQIQEKTAPVRAKSPGFLIVLGRKRQFVALLGEARELFMGAEIIGRQLQRLGPSGDAFAQRTIDIFEGDACYRSRGLISRFADAVENAARDGLLPGFIAKERVFEGDVVVARIEPHGLGKLVARGFVFADFEERVSQIFAHSRTVRRNFDGFLERGNGAVVVFGFQSCVSPFERSISGIRRLSGGERCEEDKD